MSADWQAGDRAVCVAAFHGKALLYGGGVVHVFEDNPVVGTTYIVEAVMVEGDLVGLHLHGLTTACPLGFVARKFRKLVPACDLARRHAEGVEL